MYWRRHRDETQAEHIDRIGWQCAQVTLRHTPELELEPVTARAWTEQDEARFQEWRNEPLTDSGESVEC